jgi:hypothetical protein
MTALPMPIVERIETLPALPAADTERAAHFARQDKAPATRAAYRSDFAAFQAWCSSRGVPSSRPSLRPWRASWRAKLTPAWPLRQSAVAARQSVTRTSSPATSHRPMPRRS